MQEELLIPRIDDIKLLSDRSGAPHFLGFLSESEMAKCKEHIRSFKNSVSFFGGYEGAERNFLCVAPLDFGETVFPIEAVTFKYRSQDKLTHRDVLGAVMAIGLTREKIGDILVENGRAVLFAEKTAAKFILSQVDKIGKVGVNPSFGFDFPLPETGKKQECSLTVASTRLDCIVSAICGVSRSTALEMIEKDLVSVNSFLVSKPTSKINGGDKLSIRKKGKFDIVSVDGVSKKGRTVLKYNKYIQ